MNNFEKLKQKKLKEKQELEAQMNSVSSSNLIGDSNISSKPSPTRRADDIAKQKVESVEVNEDKPINKREKIKKGNNKVPTSVTTYKMPKTLLKDIKILALECEINNRKFVAQDLVAFATRKILEKVKTDYGYYEKNILNQQLK